MDKRVDGEERRRKKIERCREFRETKKKTDPDWNAKEASRLKKYYKPKAAKSEEERLAYNQKKKELMRRRRILAKSTRELEQLKETNNKALENNTTSNPQNLLALGCTKMESMEMSTITANVADMPVQVKEEPRGIVEVAEEHTLTPFNMSDGVSLPCPDVVSGSRDGFCNVSLEEDQEEAKEEGTDKMDDSPAVGNIKYMQDDRKTSEKKEKEIGTSEVKAGVRTSEVKTKEGRTLKVKKKEGKNAKRKNKRIRSEEQRILNIVRCKMFHEIKKMTDPEWKVKEAQRIKKYYKPKAEKTEEERLAYNEKKKELMRKRRVLARAAKELGKTWETGIVEDFQSRSKVQLSTHSVIDNTDIQSNSKNDQDPHRAIGLVEASCSGNTGISTTAEASASDTCIAGEQVCDVSNRVEIKKEIIDGEEEEETEDEETDEVGKSQDSALVEYRVGDLIEVQYKGRTYIAKVDEKDGDDDGEFSVSVTFLKWSRTGYYCPKVRDEIWLIKDNIVRKIS